VRELENAVTRAATLCESEVIQAADLPPNILSSVKLSTPELDSTVTATLPEVPETALYPLHTQGDATVDGSLPGSMTNTPLVPLKTYLREQEQAYLNRVLQECGGDKEKAALELGVSLATLYRKLSGEEKDS